MILSAAIDIFAERGFAATTVSEICKRAKANIAAVNYHFGSKDALFEQVVAEAFSISEKTYPLAVRDGSDPTLQLREFMSSIILRGFDNGLAGRIDKIICHELNRPSGVHPLVLEEIQKRQGEVLRKILAKYLKTRSARLISHAHANIAALCFFVKIAPALRKKIFPEPPTRGQIERYIENQISFALAGLDALKTTFSQKQ